MRVKLFRHGPYAVLWLTFDGGPKVMVLVRAVGR